MKIKNPSINSPYFEPTKHFEFDERGITTTISEGRRPSTFFIPIPKTHGKTEQQKLEGIDSGWTEETMQENVFVNKVREKIAAWRKQDYPHLTKVSRNLLAYWTNPERSNKLFFCQIEALETMMYLAEVASKVGDQHLLQEIQRKNEEANPGLIRYGLKMATGSGKTVVMAMIIAWQSLNKITYRQDTRFSDSFAVITPGITIKDRLNVLQPNDPNNYYKLRDIVPNQELARLQQARVVITNFHQLELRTNARYSGAKVVKQEVLFESPAAMVNRVFKDIKDKQNIIVINDEAHHCYRGKPEEEKLSGDEKKEAEENNRYARVWITGIEHLRDKLGVRYVIDMSATPFFLRGSGYPEGTLFPWVVSDFSLVDAIECGIVKVPRVPTKADNITKDKEPTYRNIWLNIRDKLPKKGRLFGKYADDPHPPQELEEAILSLYENYEKYYKKYEENRRGRPDLMPPVMIIVCNNTSVSKMVYDWVAGYETEVNKQSVVKAGNLEIFRNEENGKWKEKWNTLLIDSAQLESEDNIDETFKKNFEFEIEGFKKEYKLRYGGQEPTDMEIMREVMNTVGKRGKLGENIKCVVSVSMLTEGWDVNTVTHILGVRAFSTQLLCEQVVGRGLRRTTYEVDENGMFTAEYAEVYGVPFSFIPTDETGEIPPPKELHRVKAIDGRMSEHEITFPRVEGYRFDIENVPLTADIDKANPTVIENQPTEVELNSIMGEQETHKLDTLKNKRLQEIVYQLSKSLLERYFHAKDGSLEFWRFPEIKNIVEEYIKKKVHLKDNMFYGFLLIRAYQDFAVEQIHLAIAKQASMQKILPILASYDTEGSSRYVDFVTTRDVADTIKSHINYVVLDSSWEDSVACKLEQMTEVISYVRNDHLGFQIPYEYQGQAHYYIPDFIVRIKQSNGEILNLILEVTGKKDDKKAVKVETAKTRWVPAVNNHGEFGKWAFVEIADIHNTINTIRYGLDKGFDKINSL